MERKLWIDTIRGIGMLAVIFLHTQIYYMGYEFPKGFSQNRMTLFFVVSGYFFFRSGNIDFRHKLRSMLKGIVIPYFLFMGVLQPVKALYYGDYGSMGNVFLDILLGKASWFVVALAGAELLFMLILFISKKKQWAMALCATLCLVISALLERHHLFPHNYWHFKNSLTAVFFLYLGYFYHSRESFFKRFEHRYTLLYISLLSAILVVLKYIAYQYGWYNYMMTNDMGNYPMFVADSIVGNLLLITLCKHIPRIRIFTYTGSHSLVYYFFCGAVPVAITALFNKFIFEYGGHPYRLFLVFAIVFMVETAITWAVYQYIPWSIGKKSQKI
ncbi:MAG: acyltransferase [Prevotella sp.]|nr:acyltransferase [Prevotella sp.]MDY6130823.1 acyltransferase [Prevotella sp.]